jgi:hypothetical protein
MGSLQVLPTAVAIGSTCRAVGSGSCEVQVRSFVRLFVFFFCVCVKNHGHQLLCRVADCDKPLSDAINQPATMGNILCGTDCDGVARYVKPSR